MADDDQEPVRYADWHAALVGTPTDPFNPAVSDQAPQEPIGFGAKIAKVVTGLGRGAAQMIATPSAVAQPNPYPRGSEEAAWYDNNRAATMANWAPGVAMATMGTGMPFAEPGAAGIFGGRLAQTADHAALARAEGMAAKGANPADIHTQTGWFQGPDKQWRFEIPDNLSHMKGAGTVSDLIDRSSHAAEDIFWHDPLYKAYPEVRDMFVSGHPEKSYHASDPILGNSITVSDTARSPRQVILHEMQHEIQQREGFSPGGSQASFSQGDIAAQSRDALSFNRDVERMGSPEAAAAAYEKYGLPIPKDTIELAQDFRTGAEDPAIGQKLVKMYGLDKRTNPYTPIEQYKRLAGEVEARNVEARMTMTPAERAEIKPWETQDTPTENQLVTDRAGNPIFQYHWQGGDKQILPDTITSGPYSGATTPLTGKILHHETSGESAAALIREDLTNEAAKIRPSRLFLADNPDLAIGQSGSGVKLEYNGHLVSGTEHAKPGTGDMAGREYQANGIGNGAIRRITVAPDERLDLGPAWERRVNASFARQEMPDGSTVYTNVSPDHWYRALNGN